MTASLSTSVTAVDPVRSRARLIAIVAAMLLGSACSGPDLGGRFTERDITLSDYGLFDLGAVDANGDGRLDLFTSNHSGVQSLLINHGASGFEESFSAWQLDQDPAFPGLGVVPAPVEPDQPGVYVGWRAPAVSVRASGSSAAGSIDLLTPVEIQNNDGFHVDVESADTATGVTETRITFSGGPDAHFDFVPLHHALPIVFHVDVPVDPAELFVGPGKVSPPEGTFSMSMLDRHGMAWADYNGDSMMDVFITRGGLSGTVGDSRTKLWNQLYVQGPPGRMTDVARSRRLDLGICPGRQVSWVDFDGDGRLDLYVVCGRDASGPAVTFENRLFRQNEDGSFQDAAASAGVNLGTEGKAAWLDVDGDHDQDLVWADQQGFAWYQNDHAKFRRHDIAGGDDARRVTSLRVADFDQDGDPDLLAVSDSENVLLVNDAGTLHATQAADLGLPRRSVTADWVDVDNDGTDELFAVPGGLYRRNGDGHYARTGVLDFDQPRYSPFSLADAHAVWADLDNDGSRDLVIALNLVTKKRTWARWAARLLGESNSGEGALQGHWVTRSFYGNAPSTSGHWLEVALTGPSGNRQAVGGRVRVEGAGYDRAHLVGDAESSRFSQGHYRTYFGLGSLQSVDRISVAWPDGRVQLVRQPDVDHVVTLSEEAPKGD